MKKPTPKSSRPAYLKNFSAKYRQETHPSEDVRLRTSGNSTIPSLLRKLPSSARIVGEKKTDSQALGVVTSDMEKCESVFNTEKYRFRPILETPPLNLRLVEFDTEAIPSTGHDSKRSSQPRMNWDERLVSTISETTAQWLVRSRTPAPEHRERLTHFLDSHYGSAIEGDVGRELFNEYFSDDDDGLDQVKLQTQNTPWSGEDQV